jgi:UDP:flavonoid glycosyltransferase YjiC (YdhE family)
MRILFFPSDMGGGFGHISRCLALAHEGKHRGHDCAFVINDRKYDQKIKNDFNVFIAREYPGWSSLISFVKSRMVGLKSPLVPIFTEISGLDYQVVRDGLVSEGIIRKKLTQYLKVVKKYKPDVLIGDTNLLIWMLSKKVDIPLVQIVRYASHPETADLIWWKTEPEDMIRPDSTTLFNPLLKEIGLKKINRAEELLQGDLYIVPSIPEIEPIPEDENTVHVGALTISKRNNEIPSWMQEIDGNQPLIYITIGGGAGPVGNRLFFSTIIEAFADKPLQVVVSTSSKFGPPDFANLQKNIRFFKWVPGKLLISKADLVIFHGGYGTMMESIACGKPTITIPFQSEQEGNGKRLEQLGCGLVVKLSKERFKCIEDKWRYGTYTFLVQKRYDLTAEKLSGEVDKILSNPQYLVKAKSLKEKVKEYRGPEKAIELIEKYWS